MNISRYLLLLLYIGLAFPLYGQIRPHGSRGGGSHVAPSHSYSPSHLRKMANPRSQTNGKMPKMMATPTNAYSGHNSDMQRFQTRPSIAEGAGRGLSANYNYREYHPFVPAPKKVTQSDVNPPVKTEKTQPAEPPQPANATVVVPSDVAYFHRLGDEPETSGLAAGDPYEQGQYEIRRLERLVRNGLSSYTQNGNVFARQLLREQYAPTRRLESSDWVRFHAIIETGLSPKARPQEFPRRIYRMGTLPEMKK